MDQDNILVFYYDTPCTYIFIQLSMILVPIKLILVVMSACHVYPLVRNIHEHKTVFEILEWFCSPVVNKEVDNFIILCAHYQSINSYPREVHKPIHTIDSGAPFDMILLDFWKPGNLPY